MYCNEHREMIRACSVQSGDCAICGGKTFLTFNAPPLNTICGNCSDELSICQLCGAPIRIVGYNGVFKYDKE